MVIKIKKVAKRVYLKREAGYLSGEMAILECMVFFKKHGVKKYLTSPNELAKQKREQWVAGFLTLGFQRLYYDKICFVNMIGKEIPDCEIIIRTQLKNKKVDTIFPFEIIFVRPWSVINSGGPEFNVFKLIYDKKLNKTSTYQDCHLCVYLDAKVKKKT